MIFQIRSIRPDARWRLAVLFVKLMLLRSPKGYRQQIVKRFSPISS